MYLNFRIDCWIHNSWLLPTQLRMGSLGFHFWVQCNMTPSYQEILVTWKAHKLLSLLLCQTSVNLILYFYHVSFERSLCENVMPVEWHPKDKIRLWVYLCMANRFFDNQSLLDIMIIIWLQTIYFDLFYLCCEWMVQKTK
jgi:hypothetical protein